MIEQPVNCAAIKIPDGNDVMRGNSSRAVFLKIICTFRPNVPIFMRAAKKSRQENDGRRQNDIIPSSSMYLEEYTISYKEREPCRFQ